jgi:ubiquinone biosynthesis protein UbiJ
MRCAHAGKDSPASIPARSQAAPARRPPTACSKRGNADAVPNVTIHVKLADLPLIAQNRERAFSYVRIEGDAEFANTISQLPQGLRWEPSTTSSACSGRSAQPPGRRRAFRLST